MHSSHHNRKKVEEAAENGELTKIPSTQRQRGRKALPPPCSAESPSIHLSHIAHANDADNELLHISNQLLGSHYQVSITINANIPKRLLFSSLSMLSYGEEILLKLVLRTRK